MRGYKFFEKNVREDNSMEKFIFIKTHNAYIKDLMTIQKFKIKQFYYKEGVILDKEIDSIMYYL